MHFISHLGRLFGCQITCVIYALKRKNQKTKKKLKSLFNFLKEKNTQNFIIQYFKSPSKNI
jgi:hypothetical protein